MGTLPDGHTFEIYTDHKPLQHMTSQTTISQRQVRWAQVLQQFDCTIFYKKGTDNVVSDALSRRPDLAHSSTGDPECLVDKLPKVRKMPAATRMGYHPHRPTMGPPSPTGNGTANSTADDLHRTITEALLTYRDRIEATRKSRTTRRGRRLSPLGRSVTGIEPVT